MARDAKSRGGVLTELEGAVLGNLWREGPCTAYRVRMCFAESPSAVWSGSAGSIYPLLQRLEKRGLVKSAALRQGRRGGRAYALSPAGRAALQDWVSDASAAADPGFDPLRTRGLSLSFLPSARRRRFVAAVWRELEGQRDALRARLAAAGDLSDEARVDRGVLLQIQAKLKWLSEMD